LRCGTAVLKHHPLPDRGGFSRALQNQHSGKPNCSPWLRQEDMKVAGLLKQTASDRSMQYRCPNVVLNPAGAIVSPRDMVLPVFSKEIHHA